MGGAPAQGWGDRASPSHRRRARAAWMSSIVTVLELWAEPLPGAGGEPRRWLAALTTLRGFGYRRLRASLHYDSFDRWWHSPSGAAMQVVWPMES